jgi:hypothetical protein
MATERDVADELATWKWPRWRWYDWVWITGVAASLLQVLSTLWPNLAQQSPSIRTGVVALLFVVSMCVAPVSYAIKVLRRASRIMREAGRVRTAFIDLRSEVQSGFSKGLATLKAELERCREEREEARLALLDYLAANTPYDLERVALHKDTVYVILRRKAGRPLQKGTVFVVVDQGDGQLMGEFELTNVTREEYETRAMAPPSPVWVGFLHESPTAPPPLNCKAFVLPEVESQK